MAKHFALTITDEDLTFERKRDQIDAEALLDARRPLGPAHRP
jgi:hypothetical protein